MCALLHLLICTALRAHIIVVEALYKINYYYYIVKHGTWSQTGQTLSGWSSQTRLGVEGSIHHRVDGDAVASGRRNHKHGQQVPVTQIPATNRAGIAQWLQCLTRDGKVADSSPGRRSGRIFFSGVNYFLCWFLFRCPLYPRVIAVTRKGSRTFCRRSEWLVTLNMYAPCVCDFAWNEVW